MSSKIIVENNLLNGETIDVKGGLFMRQEVPGLNRRFQLTTAPAIKPWL